VSNKIDNQRIHN